MAIDYGTRKIGLAVADELGITVRPLTTIRRQRMNRQQVFDRIAQLAAENEIGTLVVGLPLRADGTRGKAALQVEKFISELQSRLSVPVVACNEFLSSREADEILRASGADCKTRRARSDEYAATVILRDYLDAHSISSGVDDSADLPHD